MSLAVEISGLKKHYKGAWSPALDGLDLSIRQHGIYGLLGPNGAGKTTTINILCGLVDADAGKATVLGKDCRRQKMSIRKCTGIVPQQIALFANLTAWENYRYIGRLYNLSEFQIKKRASALLQRLGLYAHADKRIASYSGGMKRRANIIASLLHEPELLILDEPTAGVDVQSRAMILDFLLEYKQQGKTIIYTSHLLEEAEQICDDIAIIDEGRLIVTGAPKTLVQNTPECRRLEDVFLHYTGFKLRDKE